MTAARTAIAALERERQRIAFDANLYAAGLADYPHARACFERRQAIDAEIARLRENRPRQTSFFDDEKAAGAGANRAGRRK